MASMFRKPKRNFRKKGTAFDDENDHDDTNGDVEMEEPFQPKPEKKKKNKNKDCEPKSKSVLSFEMEEEDDAAVEFKIKRSSHSRRVAKQLKKELKEKERSKELKDVKKTISQSESDEEEHRRRIDDAAQEKQRERQRKEEEEARQAAEKLKKLREEFKTLNGEDIVDSSDDDEEKGFKAKLARGEIPDAKTIHFIRKQRQMARETDGFIPVEETTTSAKSSTQRLVRDDDNDKSDDEDEDRVDFRIDQAARERQEMRDKFLATEHGSDEESDDNNREWENQQIMKAVNLNVPHLDLAPNHDSNDSGSQVAFMASATTTNQSSNGIQKDEMQKPFSALAKGTPVSDITIESVRKQMEERLDVADTVHRGHKMEYDRAQSDLAEATGNIGECERKAPDLENRYRFFQELRGYVRDLLECLNEKVPVINDMESRINNILKSRADRLVKRRQQDIRDQCREYMTNTASVKLDTDAGEERLRQRRVAEREARRSRRKRAREAKSIQGHYEGLSSDDEDSSQSLAMKFQNEVESVKTNQAVLFEDVVEDFSSPDCVKENFERWKFTYGDTYQEAYIGLCLPKLFNPFVRNDLILWNPLNENNTDFEMSGWFNTLIFMGYRDGADIDRQDDDLQIVPSIVEKIIVPKLTFLVQEVWDPLSTTQTARLVNLIMKLTRDYPNIQANSKYFRAFMEAVVARLKKTLDDDVFMPMYPLSVLDNRSSGAAMFFHRQSWACIKLLGNILSWNQLISPPVLQKLALSGLLNRYVVIGLASSHINKEALHKCQMIISSLPKAWFADLEGDSTLPQLENLCRYLVSAARTLHKATSLERDAERLEGREFVKQISKHLINIHAMDHAVTLANELSFKI